MTHTFKLSRRTARFRAVSVASLLTFLGACDNTQSLEPATAAEDAALSPPTFAVTSTSISISNISARSGKTYRVGWDLTAGDVEYVDRTYAYASPIPTVAQGLAYIQTANDDKNAYAGSTSFLSFDISKDATIYVGHDNRIPRPTWLTSGFQDTGVDLLSSDGSMRFSLFKRNYTAGHVTLGSNVTSTVADGSMYVVLVSPIQSTSSSTTEAATVSGTGIPFGSAGLPTSQYTNSIWTGSLQHFTPGSTALSMLAAAQSSGERLVVSLAGGRSSYKNADGTFSMSKWKYNIDQWRSVNIAPYVKDGTIIGHYLVDEPFWPGSWGGKAITVAQLQEMARYSKSIWPTMATTIRVRPGMLIGYSWPDLDFAWSQWEGPLHGTSYRKTPEEWRDKEIADAKAAGLKLIFGMNFLDAGDGSSGIVGTYDLRYSNDRWQMAATEVERVGKVLAAATYACGLINWRWSPTYPKASYMTTAQITAIRAFDGRSDVKTAMARVSGVARNRTATSCKK